MATTKAAEIPGLDHYLLTLGDDALVLGHRLSEWCGHGPILEEDIALANMALDCLGHAGLFLEQAAVAEGRGRSADDLAFGRDTLEFRNHLLVEQPNGDFAVTIMRQFFFAAYASLLYDRLSTVAHRPLAEVAAKAVKESRYHLRHAREWVIRLGDGTEESHGRAQAAVEELWMFTGELFRPDDLELRLIEAGQVADRAALHGEWLEEVRTTFTEATLPLPSADAHMLTGGTKGLHTEHLGHMLAEMQVLPRTYPGATW